MPCTLPGPEPSLAEAELPPQPGGRVLQASAHGGHRRHHSPWAHGSVGAVASAGPIPPASAHPGDRRGTQELLAGFSLLGELEEEDEEEEKLTPARPGGSVAVFCPVRLFRQTGQLSCLAFLAFLPGSQRALWEGRITTSCIELALTISTGGTTAQSTQHACVACMSV